ncbi:hypothetical protein CCOS865_00421 [Pseudomonas reidholzensis]|uniref:Uncharacterized protein n=1 Tax=Pseudomonas reidholzensis TaxID=1785162 RepID=A0A383RM89_9PSED|nr:hypothetical protein [Pseudomonas reidholzensis]SYX88199.1 hypothetical protein CCOS865_00421 [Pseudomonas reidholzensis]
MSTSLSLDGQPSSIRRSTAQSILQEALAWVAANQGDLLKEWMKWH